MATTSHHLQVLRRARLVDAQKSGLYVTYRLADPQVGAFFLRLRGLAESRLAEVQQVTRQYLEERGALEAVDNVELVRRVRAGQVTLIDVRPGDEYLAGHIPGAVSMPLADLKKNLATLPGRSSNFRPCAGTFPARQRPSTGNTSAALLGTCLGSLASLLQFHKTEHHVLRVVALSIVLTLAVGQNAGLLCKVWCDPQVAAATGCHGEASSGPTSVTGGSCDHLVPNLCAFLREDGPRATATPDAAPAILVLRYVARLTASARPRQQAERWGSLEKPPLTTTLRI